MSSMSMQAEQGCSPDWDWLCGTGTPAQVCLEGRDAHRGIRTAWIHCLHHPAQNKVSWWIVTVLPTPTGSLCLQLCSPALLLSCKVGKVKAIHNSELQKQKHPEGCEVQTDNKPSLGRPSFLRALFKDSNIPLCTKILLSLVLYLFSSVSADFSTTVPVSGTRQVPELCWDGPGKILNRKIKGEKCGQSKEQQS